MTKRYSYHKCDQWKEHENEPFNISTEVQIQKTGDKKNGFLLVFDVFTKATPDDFLRKHTSMFAIPIGFCPFCGKGIH